MINQSIIISRYIRVRNPLYIRRPNFRSTTTTTADAPNKKKRFLNSSSRNNSNNNNNNSKKSDVEISTTGPLFPYSGSLPSPGYEWCRKCNIPSRHLQKEIGKPNPCMMMMENEMATPTTSATSATSKTSPFRGYIMNYIIFGTRFTSFCQPAKQYYKQQFQIMVFLTALIFIVVPPWEKIEDNDDDGVVVVADIDIDSTDNTNIVEKDAAGKNTAA